MERNIDSENKIDKTIDKSVGFLFKNKALVVILLIFFLGTILRYVAANNVEPNADEMVHGPHAAGIIDSGVIGRVWESILWSYLTDFFYSIFGITMLTARLLSFIFGILTIILVYILAKEIFKNERIALIASFLMAISSFTIIYTLIEMDIAATFFILLAALFFIRRLKKDGKISYWAAAFIGVGALIKTLALFFVPAFAIFYFMHHKKIWDKKLIFDIIKFGLLILLVFSPILIHNWLWYHDKMMVDAYFAQFFDVGKTREAYAGVAGVGDGFRFNDMLFGAFGILKALFKIEPIITLLGILGLLFFAQTKERYALFFTALQIFPFLGIDLTNRLETHYIVLIPVFALYGGAFINTLAEKYSAAKISAKKIIIFLMIIALIVNIYIMFPYLSTQTAVAKMKSYTNENIKENDIVIVDTRIYRGRIMWLFLDTHYLEAISFPEFIELNKNATGNLQTYKLYYIECVPDDCGWGTIKDQPELNQAMEEITSFFKANAQEIKVLNGGGSPVISKEPYFRVYSTNINLKPRLIERIDSTHNFFYYPERYEPKEEIFDNYNFSGAINKGLFMLAKLIIWAGFVIALLAIPMMFYLLWREFRISLF